MGLESSNILPRFCSNIDGAMHRVHIRQIENNKQQWLAIGWQYCPACGMMLPD
jgi:hypothetical protein